MSGGIDQFASCCLTYLVSFAKVKGMSFSRNPFPPLHTTCFVKGFLLLNDNNSDDFAGFQLLQKSLFASQLIDSLTPTNDTFHSKFLSQIVVLLIKFLISLGMQALLEVRKRHTIFARKGFAIMSKLHGLWGGTEHSKFTNRVLFRNAQIA